MAFSIPILREVAELVCGALEATEEDIEGALKAGKSVMILTGGVREIRETSRNTMGVKLINLQSGEKLQCIAPVVADEDETETAAESTPELPLTEA